MVLGFRSDSSLEIRIRSRLKGHVLDEVKIKDVGFETEVGL